MVFNWTEAMFMSFEGMPTIELSQLLDTFRDVCASGSQAVVCCGILSLKCLCNYFIKTKFKELIFNVVKVFINTILLPNSSWTYSGGKKFFRTMLPRKF